MSQQMMTNVEGVDPEDLRTAEFLYCNTGDRSVLKALLDAHRDPTTGILKIRPQKTSKLIDQRIPELNLEPSKPIEEEAPVGNICSYHGISQALLKVITLVDGSTWAVSSEEIKGLLLDLGLKLQDMDRILALNNDVHEDPLNRGDSLGNVLMINRKQSLKVNQLPLLGTLLLDLVHHWSQIEKQSDQNYVDIDQLSHDISDQDDIEAEDILAAKRKIAHLRRKNILLDKRNRKLWARVKILRRKLGEDGKPILKEFHPCHFPSACEPRKAPTASICTRRGKVAKSKLHPRKMQNDEVSDSQVNFSW